MIDQERFAAFSGDRNPMHLDPAQARRTQAGEPVVHGIHLLLWALDSFARQTGAPPPISSIRVQFSRFVYLGERAEVVLLEKTNSKARLAVTAGSVAKSKITLNFGTVAQAGPTWTAGIREIVPQVDEAKNLSMAELNGAGLLEIGARVNQAAGMFEAASRWLHAQRIAAIAATTYLVGMVSPGLHSIYDGLSLQFCPLSNEERHLAFRTVTADSRVRFVEHEVAGSGIFGTVTGFMRMPPTQQPPMSALRSLVGPVEFAGARALVAGASRGLGELAAKLLAAGGADVVITWRTGVSDASRVTEEIREAGGRCAAIPYDALKPPAEQLGQLAEPPTHAYYFATPPIFRQQADTFAAARFEEFLKYYVEGFWHFAMYLRERNARISLFYPSSVFVHDRPKGMTEYAMAKAAGEALCTDINSSLAPLHVTHSRLPRLPTDQTASISETETGDPVAVMLRAVRDTQSWPR